MCQILRYKANIKYLYFAMVNSFFMYIYTQDILQYHVCKYMLLF